MKLGFVSAILDKSSFEEMIDTASELGFQSVEVACWPQGKTERRYAGVSHINVDDLDEKKVSYIKDYCAKRNVKISSLAYYPNAMNPDPDKRRVAAEHMKKLIVASRKLGVGMVTTFIGRDQTKTVEWNLERVKEIWPPILDLAKENNVKVAIENCPILFGPDQWLSGQKLTLTPAIWKNVWWTESDDDIGNPEESI